MPDVLQTYKFGFEFDSKDIKKQLKAVSLDVKDLVSQMGDASDKVTVFKDLVTYISNVDKALTMFKNNHKDTFANLFGNPDADITSVLTKIFDTTTQAAQGFGDLKDKIDAAANGKASTKQLKALAEEMNNLFMSVGKDAPFPNIDEAFDHKRYSTKINMMKNALAEFGTVFADMQDKLRQGFNFGGGSGGGFGSGTGGSGVVTQIQSVIDSIKAKNKELAEARANSQKILNEFKNIDKNGISDAYKVEVTKESVHNLISEYDTLKSNLESTDASTAEYYNTLTKLLTVSLKLKSAFRDVMSNADLQNQFRGTDAPSGHHDLLAALSAYGMHKNPIDAFVQKNIDENKIGQVISGNESIIKELQSAENINDVINNVIAKRVKLYDELTEKYNQYKNLYNSSPELNDEQTAALEGKAGEIAKLIGVTGKIEDVNTMLETLSINSSNAGDAVLKLFTTFGMDTPDQMINKFKTLFPGSEFAPSISATNQAVSTTSSPSVVETSREYDELTNKVREYLEIRDKISNFNGDKMSSEFRELSNQSKQLSAEIENLKRLDDNQLDALYDAFDEADQPGAKNRFSEIFEKFRNALGIEIPKAANNAASATTGAFSQITKGAEDASKATQNVMYHLGNLLNGQGRARDTFGDMPSNLIEQAKDTRYEQYGFGVLGGGLFGVSDPSLITQEPGRTSFIQSVDLSKYNMYMANTEERAVALMDFLSKLQKFSIKSAEPNYTGFDAQLQGLDVTSLYNQFKVVFDQSELTKEQFNSFINEMVSMLKQAGLAFDSKTGELNFTNLTDEIANSENISTRFMKMLGYQGVNVGGTSFDGFGQGNVLFDFDKVDIVGYFNSVKDAVEDYQKIMSQTSGNEWVGSNEQLKQYANNIDEIIAKITQYKDAGKLKNVVGVDETLSKLSQIKQNINDVLSGKDIGSDTPFTTITTGSANAGNAIDEAKAKFESFLALTNEITGKSFYNMGDATDNIAIGQYTEKLDIAQKELQELGDQGLLTAEQLEAVTTAYRNAFNHLDNNKVTYDDYYSSGRYSSTYIDEYREERDRANNAEYENTALKSKLEILEQIAAIDKQIGSTYDHQVDELDSLIQKRKEILEEARLSMSLDDATLQTQQEITQQYEARSKSIHDGYDSAYSELMDLSKADFSKASLSEIDSYIVKLSELYNILREANNNYLLGDHFSDIEKRYNEMMSALQNARSGFMPGAADGSRKDALMGELDIYDTKAYYDASELQNILNTRNDVLQTLKQEKLISDETLAQQETINAEIVKRIEHFNALVNAEQSFNKMDALHDAANMDDLNSVVQLLESRKAIMSNISPLAFENYSHSIFAEGDMNKETFSNAEAENASLERRIELLRQVEQGYIRIDDVDDIMQETGSLDAKMERLRDFVELNDLTEKPAKDFTLDDELAEFEKIYDRIIIKLANGKNIEILPDLKGYNALSKFYNSDAGQYGPTEIADIVFNRKKEQEVLQQNTKELQNQLGLQQQLEEKKVVSQPVTSATTAAQGEKVVEVSQEVQQLNELKLALVEVKNAVSAKTKAFYDEGAVVGQVVGKEISALQRMRELLISIEEIVKRIDIKTLVTDVKSTTDAISNANNQNNNNDSFNLEKARQTGRFNNYTKSLGDAVYLTDEFKQKLKDLETELKGISKSSDLEIWAQKFQDLSRVISSEKWAYEASYTGQLNKIVDPLNSQFKELDFKENTSGLTQEQQAIVDGYARIKQSVADASNAIKNGKEANISAIQDEAKALSDLIEKYKTEHNIVNAGGSATKKAPKYRQVTTATTMYGALSERANSEAFKDSDVVQQALAKYTNAYNQLLSIQDKFKVGENLTGDQEAAFGRAQIACTDYARELRHLLDTSDKLTKQGENIKSIDHGDWENRKNVLREYVQEFYGSSATIGDFDKNFTKLLFTVKNGDGTFSNMSANIDESRSKIVTLTGSTKKYVTEFERFKASLKHSMGNVLRYVSTFGSFYRVISIVRKGIQYVKDIDKALTELKKVTDETNESYDKFLQTASKTGAKIGTTVADFVNATADFARLGYNMEQAASLAEAASIYKNVGDGITDISQATESIISTMKAFGIEADNSIGIVDRFNEVGNNFAISSTGIGEAMQRSASALYEAGNTIDESIALITGANSVVIFVPRRYSNIVTSR